MLTKEQIADLAQLHLVADRFSAEITIIGATAILCLSNSDDSLWTSISSWRSISRSSRLFRKNSRN